MASDDIPSLTVHQVAARIGEAGFVVYDNNGKGRWARGHVPGATNLNPHFIEAADLPDDKDATLVFYCSGPG